MQNKLLTLDTAGVKFDSEHGTFEGYASVFGGVDSYRDTIEKGAYKETIENRDRPVMMYFNHNSDQVIGKWVEMREDDKGLYVKGELTSGHSLASDVRASLKHGAITGLSIGYRIPKGGSEYDEDKDVRILKKIELHEVSVVTVPADNDARIDVTTVKSADFSTVRDLEDCLRESGFSKSAAQAFLSRAREVLRDSGPKTLDKEQIKKLFKQED